MGGRDGYVDVEDVYWKCFELAPKRFGWRTRPEIPDLQKISVARRDAIKKQASAGVEFINAQEADVRFGRPVPAYKWRLTALGNEWVEANASRLNRLYGGGAVPAPPRRADEARLRTIRASSTFQAWKTKGNVESEIWELADLLDCSPASPSEVWSLRLDSLQNAADHGADDEVMQFVTALRKKLKGTVLR
jgi:hypothetical protein